MSNFHLEGLGVALVTPFKSDKTIDFEALGRLIDFQITAGVDFMVVLGTTGETPTLSRDGSLGVFRNNFCK
jgi:4-hydroxy-tetrahydrodipicolinate synthase